MKHNLIADNYCKAEVFLKIVWANFLVDKVHLMFLMSDPEGNS